MPSAASAKLEKASSVPVAETTTATTVVANIGSVTASVPSTITAVVPVDNSSAVSTPIKQTLVIIEHKIRNLEKRKTKLESYRAIQSSGKELSADQKQAVAKYDEVAQCLEFARELTKQMIQLSNNAEKDQKKLARREAVQRAQAETLKIREVLTIQNILEQFADVNIREDFINGTNGAIKLEEFELNALEKFYIDIHVKRQETPDDTPFLVCAQKAAELLSFTIDGRPKQYGELTFESLRKIFQNIQECGYFDCAGKMECTDEEIVDDTETETDQIQAQDNDNANDSNNSTGTDQENPTNEMVAEEVDQIQMTQPQQLSHVSHVDVPKFEAPSAAAVPAPAFPQPAIIQQQPQSVQPQNLINAQMPPPQSQLQRPVLVPSVVAASVTGVVAHQPPQIAQVAPTVVPTAAAGQIHAGHYPPTTVRAVEQGYFKQHQYIQQMRPLAEVIGSTNFYFLQESELDSPDMVPSGFTPNDGQLSATAAINPGVIPPQSPNSIPQQIIQQQQQQPISIQISMPQPGIQQNSQPTLAATIPSQTFTNQSFPPIVPPPTAIYPQVVQNSEISNTQPQQQMSIVYPPQQQQQQPAPMPIQSLVGPQQAVVSQQNQAQILNSMGESQPVVDAISQAANVANLITGPSSANVPMPGFPHNKFQQPQNPVMATVHPQSVNQLPTSDNFDTIQQSSQSLNDKQQQIDDINDTRTVVVDSNDWDANEPHAQKSHVIPTRNDDDSNQWSNDVVTTSSNSKHDWNSNYDNQNDSNTWKNIPNDNYPPGRNGGRNNFAGGNNRSNTGRGSGGNGIRGHNTGGSSSGSGPSSNGYRGRANNSYQQQQNGRNTGMYFRNNNENSSGYYQNQNGSGGGSFNNKDSTGSYVGNTNNYRSRGGPVPPARQQSGGRGGPSNSGGGGSGSGPNTNRTNVGGMSSNPNPRSGRNNNPGNAYGSSRPPPNNVRQQQDINA